MGLTSYEKTVENLRKAYEALTKAVDRGGDMAVYTAFQCQCAVEDALNVFGQCAGEGALNVLGKPVWVSVNKLLPKPYKDVLVYVVCGNKWALAVGWLNGDEWVINDKDVDFYTVTHWTLIPKPPKEE